MKTKNKFYLLFAFFLMNFAFTQTMFSQNGQYDVKAVADCSELDQGNYYVEIYLKAHSASTTFRLAEQNYRFSFTDNDAIQNPTPDATNGMSGIITDATGEISFFDNITTTGSLDTVVSFNFELVGGAGYFITDVDWTYIGRVKFDVLDACKPVEIKIHDNEIINFPPTVIIEKYNGFLFGVDEGDYIFENSAGCPTGPVGKYKVKAVSDCSELDQGNYYVEMYLQANDASSTFRLSDQNYRFSFTPGTIANPTPDQTGGLDGITTDPTGAVSLYDGITTTGSLDTVVSYNIELSGGPGHYISDTDWTYIGRVKFDVLDDCKTVDIKLHDKQPINFPPTFIGEKYCDSWYTAEEGSYEFEKNANCPAGPVGQYNVKAVGDCSEVGQGNYYAEIYLQATDATTTFRVSDQNYRFSFTPGSIENPTPDQTGGLDGMTTDQTNETSLYDWITTTGSLDTVVSYNIELNGGPGYLITDVDWTYIGRVKFDVLDASIPVELVIHDKDPDNFPPTFIGEKDCELLYTATEGGYVVEDCFVPTCTPTEIANDGFETDWGIWNDGGGDCHFYTYAPYAPTGSNSIRLRDNTGGSDMYTDALDLTQYDEITVDFAFKSVGMNNGHDFWLQVSTDNGSTFTTVEAWVHGVDFTNSQSTATLKTATIAGPFTAETVLKFRCDAANNGDRIHMDDIVINGCQNASSNSIGSVEPEERLMSRSSDIEDTSMKLTPNPASTQVTIAMNISSSERAQIMIRDYTGKTMMEKVVSNEGVQEIQVDVTAFAPGIYFATLLADGKNKTQKFVVVK